MVWWTEYLNKIQKAWVWAVAFIVSHPPSLFKGESTVYACDYISPTPFLRLFSLVYWTTRRTCSPRLCGDTGWINIEWMLVYSWGVPLNTSVTLNNLLGIFELSFFLYEWGITGMWWRSHGRMSVMLLSEVLSIKSFSSSTRTLSF